MHIADDILRYGSTRANSCLTSVLNLGLGLKAEEQNECVRGIIRGTLSPGGWCGGTRVQLDKAKQAALIEM